jgi:hypothetical protein
MRIASCRNNLVEYAPTWAIGRTKLARFCFWLQRPSHVCHFSGHFWWVESPYICISASGVHSSSILVAPDVSIVYQDKAWKLGDLKMRFPMFCLIRSHSFRSLNFDALQDPILMISRGSSAPQPFVKTYCKSSWLVNGDYKLIVRISHVYRCYSYNQPSIICQIYPHV